MMTALWMCEITYYHVRTSLSQTAQSHHRGRTKRESRWWHANRRQVNSTRKEENWQFNRIKFIWIADRKLGDMFVPFQVIKFLFIIFFKMVAFSFSWKSLSVIGWVATKPTADWNRIVYRAICMFLRPPISCLGGVILNQRRWYRRFKRGVKTIEIRLCRKTDQRTCLDDWSKRLATVGIQLAIGWVAIKRSADWNRI